MRVKYSIVVSLMFLFVSPAFSQEIVGTSVANYSSEAFKVVLSLMFVLCVFYFGAMAFKKYLGASFKENTSIKLIGGMSLSNKEKLVLVEAGNVNLLLGVSSSGVTKLHKFEQNELPVNTETHKQQHGSFGEKLEQILAKK